MIDLVEVNNSGGDHSSFFIFELYQSTENQS